MTGGFKVGEVLVGVGLVNFQEYNGCECVVLESLATRVVMDLTTLKVDVALTYLVQWTDGLTINAHPRNLRRKQPPAAMDSILRMFELTTPAPREVEAA